jgi:hypothetical protein
MAITTTTISRSAGFARSDLITQVEEAFTWLGWHGDTRTGIVTAISSYSGGGTVGSSGTDYHDVFPVSTTGIGTGASFYVERSNGSILRVRVNRPGYGYTTGEYVTLSAEDIGGSSNGAVAIGITVMASPVGYGSTNQFLAKELNGTNPWGVVRHEIQANKKFGNTYRSFQPYSNTAYYINTGSDFHPYPTTNLSDGGNMYQNRFAGSRYLDIPSDPDSSAIYHTSSTPQAVNALTLTVASSTSYQLDLNIFRSSIDPNFAVFSYKQPTLSSTTIYNNTFGTYFLHNFTSSLWDYDYLFLGGVTFITPTNDIGAISFDTYFPSADNTKRAAEWGWSSNGSTPYKTSRYESSVYQQGSTDQNNFYYRSSDRSFGGQSATTDSLDPSTYFNAVIKGIPLSTTMIPCPYYLPDDFVLIDFQYNIPNANIQQGDTITISGSEVYTVITGSYNQTTTTRGILFCARTV